MSDSSFSFISPSPFVAAHSRALQLFRGDEDRVVELFGQAHKLVLSGEGSKIGKHVQHPIGIHVSTLHALKEL
jgi:hypothetical protein